MSFGKTWAEANLKTLRKKRALPCRGESVSLRPLPTSIMTEPRLFLSPLFSAGMRCSRTKAAGLDLVSHSSGAVFFDYNNDGLLDLLVCNVGTYTSDKKGAQGQYVGLPDAFGGHLHPQRFEYPVLYENLGHDRFKDVTAQVGLRPTGWCGDASFADLNGTGFPSLFILNMQGHDHYLENAGGKKFIDK